LFKIQSKRVYQVVTYSVIQREDSSC